MRRFLARVGHGHGHVAGTDPALESSTDGIRALRLSLAVLAATAVAQGVAVVLSGSVGLLGDTLHNFADALTAVPLWFAFRLGRRAPNSRFTYGYGRAEDVAGIVVVLVVAGSAALAGYEAIERLMHPRPVDLLGVVALAGAVGFVGNEFAARIRIRTGRRIGSAALVADGLHARTDGLTSLAVVAGAAGVAAGWAAADAIAGLVITAAILIVCRDAARMVLVRLLDAVDPEVSHQISHVITSTPGVEALDGVRSRWIGHRLHIEVEISVAPDWTLGQSHGVAHDLEHRLLHLVPRVGDVIVHVSPAARSGRDPHSLLAHHRDGASHDHDFESG
ncbi:MAG TPA: cation diffusion facilitator family transporter [Acidimicrobiia bacterium]|nr:cation diffusion facilitator family transporter [Acidimicrobiia bacterium]